MRGEPRKAQKRKRETGQARKAAVSSQTTEESDPYHEESNTVPCSENGTASSQFTVNSIASTPKRTRGCTRQREEVRLTSTPIHPSSTDVLPSPGGHQMELRNTELTAQMSKSNSEMISNSKPESTCRTDLSTQPRQLRKRAPKEMTQTHRNTKSAPAKSRTKKMETEETTTPTSQQQRQTLEPQQAEPDIQGEPRKTQKRKPETRQARKAAISSHTTEESDPDHEESNTAPCSENETASSQFTVNSIASTPKRTRGCTRQREEVCLTSTPIHPSSTDVLPSPGGHQMESTCRTDLSTQPRQLRKRAPKETTQTHRNTKSAPAKSRTKKMETEETTTPTSQQQRQTLEPQQAEPDIQEDESSELSIELSDHEERLHFPSLLLEDDEETDEEEDLPSLASLMQSYKEPEITEGTFVWCKFRHYPFWPAVTKRVNRKRRRASIQFIDGTIGQNKGLTVALRSLKPFGCEDEKELVDKAKEEYSSAVEWSLELIADYRIRIVCGTFSGSFFEYFAHHMSYPVRRKYPEDASKRVTIASDSVLEAQWEDDKGDSIIEEEQKGKRSVAKRLLPDRSLAAFNRTTMKLVNFIVKQRKVEEHLKAVISGQQQSKWVHLSNSKQIVNIYFEDDQQQDQVYRYLNNLYNNGAATTSCQDLINSMDSVPFILDVLLPEAIIHAIAGVDKISVEKAEEKYLKGRPLSNREIQEFNLMLDRVKEEHNL